MFSKYPLLKSSTTLTFSILLSFNRAATKLDPIKPASVTKNFFSVLKHFQNDQLHLYVVNKTFLFINF